MKMLCGHFGEADAAPSSQITEVKPTVQVTKLEAETPIIGAQSLSQAAPDASAGSQGMEYGIMNRLYMREPSMVAFTGDELENEIRAELAAWSDEDSADFFFDDETGSSMDSQAQAALELQTAAMTKVTLTDIAKAKEAEAQKPNKVLVYGGLAAVAAFLFFKE